MKPEWRRAGRATGKVRCELVLPAVDFIADRSSNARHAVTQLSRFIRSQMPSAESALVGATFTVSAEVRSPGLGVRWKPICRWKAGESMEAALQRARDAWTKLPKEDWPGIYERRFIIKAKSK